MAVKGLMSQEVQVAV